MTMMAPDSLRSAKLARLRSRVATGRYVIDLDRLANRIVAVETAEPATPPTR